MIIATLMDIYDQLRLQWNAWLAEVFPSAVPFPPLVEIPGRDVLFSQLQELRDSHACALAMRQAAIATLSKELAAAETRIETIRQQITEQHRADWLANLQAGNEIERLTAMIIQKAPLSLGMFVEEIDSELTRLRQMEPTTFPTGSDRISLTKNIITYQTNSASIRRRVSAVQAARERAVAMQTENMTVKEILDEVDRLRKGLPEIRDEETRGAHAAMVLG